MRQLLKRIYYALRPANRLVLLDYAIQPRALYTKSQPHRKLFSLISTNDNAYAHWLERALSFKENFLSLQDASTQKDPLQPAWNNGYVPGLDLIILYTLVNHLRPENYVEIGSGTTTRMVNKARQDHQLDLTITCIDPHPRSEIRQIADTWMPHRIQDQPLDIFRQLKANDIVFFDGTHTLLPNSDVAWFFMEILPVLAPGVVVQVHDIYLPYDYPQFMLDRYYSENYLLGALIVNSPEKFEIIAPNFYISENEKLAAILAPVWNEPSMQHVERHGGSFWFRIR